MNQRFLIAVAALSIASAASAQFVDDEFDSSSLGAQWTQHDSTPAGSTFTLTGSHLSLVPKEGSDFYFFVDDQAYVQQNAPAGTDWEVVTKIDNFDPLTTGARRSYQRAGIQLWQDDNHYLAIGILTNGDGTDMGIQTWYQTDPVTDPLQMDRDDRWWGNEYYLGGVTTSPVYLKIRKGQKGYQALYSLDNSEWIAACALMRNPETTDGSFVNEKIRLYQSGGPGTGTGTSTEADFDYARASSIAPERTGNLNDDFSDAGASDTIWDFYHGFEPGSISISGGLLNLTPGRYQDQWMTIERAMHAYQDAPTSAAFVVQTKVTGPLDLRPFEQWNGYGIMLWQDHANWILISNQRSDITPASNRVEVGFKRAGAFDAINTELGAALPEYLQIERSGTEYIPRYSFDGTTWVTLPAGGYTHAAGLRNAQVRLFNKRVFDGAVAPAATAQFDSYETLEVPTAAGDWQLFE